MLDLAENITLNTDELINAADLLNQTISDLTINIEEPTQLQLDIQNIVIISHVEPITPVAPVMPTLSNNIKLHIIEPFYEEPIPSQQFINRRMPLKSRKLNMSIIYRLQPIQKPHSHLRKLNF